MHRIVLVAAIAAFCGATAAAQVADGARSGATSYGKGSTGPTFAISGADTLVATAPAPTGVNVGLDGKPVPMGLGADPDNSGSEPSPAGTSGPTR
jgi:hypothetical protein